MGFPGGSDGKESACSAGDQVWSLGQEVPVEKEMAPHSSILTWEVPCAEEPGELRSMGSQKSETTEQLTPSLSDIHAVCCLWQMAPNLPKNHLFYFMWNLKKKKKTKGLPWWRWVEILLLIQGTWVWSLVQEDSMCCRATKPLSHDYWACALEPNSRNDWSPWA